MASRSSNARIIEKSEGDGGAAPWRRRTESRHTYFVGEEGVPVHNNCMVTRNPGEGGSGSVRPEAAVTGSKKHGVKWPEGSHSIVHMPNGNTQPATRMWIRNNGTGTWHGYPMQ